MTSPIQPRGMSLRPRQGFAPGNTALSHASITIRALSLGLGIVAFLALCLIDIGCAGISSGKSAPQNNAPSTSTASISGSISPAANGSGATLTLSGAASATTTADASGNYSFTGLGNGSYTITPSKTGFNFGPSSQTATVNGSNVTGINFTAASTSSPSYGISGSISPAADGSGATVTLSGAASATTTADASGNYSFSALGNGSYTITPSKSGFSFSPPSQSETVNGADISGVNFAASAEVAAQGTLIIFGTISPATNGSGATVTLSGAASATTAADTSGHFSFTGLSNGSYTVTPSKSGFSFNPPSQSETLDAADVSGVNFVVSAQGATVNVSPGTDIPSLVNSSPAGTTFVIAPGTYRLTQSILPKDGDSFIGQTACAPPASACPAILSGSVVIGPSATFDGVNYKVINQTQQGMQALSTSNCDPGWLGCIYPEDLFFDGVPYEHLYSATLPAIDSGQWWFDYTNHIIYFHDNPAGHTVETSVLNNAFGGTANNVTVQYLTIEEFADMYPTGAFADVQGTNVLTQETNWTIENSEVTLNHDFGVRVNYQMQVLNNYIHDNGGTGIGGGIGTTTNPTTQSTNANILIQGNVINHNNYAHFLPGFGSGGVKAGSTSGMVLRGNTIQNNNGAGIHFDVNSQNEFVDGNTITDNTDADGLVQEISYGTSTFRNNVVLRNGVQVNNSNPAAQITSQASAGVEAYCNVMEVPNAGPAIGGWRIGAADRGNSDYPPNQYLATTGNSFHHNTVVWDADTGEVGYNQEDAANQPNFFADNTPPDFNTYHLANASDLDFSYDNNNSQQNLPKTFSQYQATGADVHGTADANNNSGYPAVAITSPADQSSFSNAVTLAASASDPRGISKVEFYVDWNLETTVTNSPYTFNWSDGSSGSHTVAAMAYSNAGIRACNAVTLTKQ
jgi:parallel beta-helix repeat protein